MILVGQKALQGACSVKAKGLRTPRSSLPPGGNPGFPLPLAGSSLPTMIF